MSCSTHCALAAFGPEISVEMNTSTLSLSIIDERIAKPESRHVLDLMGLHQITVLVDLKAVPDSASPEITDSR